MALTYLLPTTSISVVLGSPIYLCEVVELASE